MWVTGKYILQEILCQTFITNRSITVIRTTKERFIKSTDNNCVYGPCIKASPEFGKERKLERVSQEETPLLPSGVCFYLTLFAKLGNFLKYS